MMALFLAKIMFQDECLVVTTLSVPRWRSNGLYEWVNRLRLNIYQVHISGM